jgi:hypothetical protein
MFEGESSDLAYKGPAQHVELDGQQYFSLKVLADNGQQTGDIVVPFTSGPFNWSDYQDGTLPAVPWSLAHRDRGVLYDHDGIRLEVLDYLSNSEIIRLQPEYTVRPVPFNKDANRILRQARVRLTVDDRSEEFWMPCSLLDPLEKLAVTLPEALFNHEVASKGRRVTLSFAPESFHIGYAIHVRKAWRKLDPGTRKVSFYGSEIDMTPNQYVTASGLKLGAGTGQPTAYEKLLVTLNAPLDFADPAHPGQSYRMFQATMPPHRYTPQERKLKLGEPAYLTGFTLNNDPGRGLTYVGCLLIVAGIFAAYFVRFAGPGRRAVLTGGEEP